MLKKVTTSFITGAIGDALGAPIEGLRKLRNITDKYGEKGLSEMIDYKSHFEKDVTYKAGSITDDTSTAMITTQALIKTIEEVPTKYSKEFTEKLNYYTWQAHLNWAAKQIYYPLGDKLINKDIEWSNLTKKFFFACGAGRGTLASLCQPKHGTLENPLNFEQEIEGKIIKTPNLGCGGMMRIAPIAFIPNFTDAEIFETACSNASITHGGQAAYVATGITALFVRNATKDLSMSKNIEATKETLSNYKTNPLFKDGIKECVKAIDYAITLPTEFKLEAIDNIPKDLGYKNPFLAVPVLAQVTYAMMHTHSAKNVKPALILSANHSGDSDSVAAIFGNIAGARYEQNSAIDKWAGKISLRGEVETSAKKLAKSLNIS